VLDAWDQSPSLRCGGKGAEGAKTKSKAGNFLTTDFTDRRETTILADRGHHEKH
jgi:hypothetical protein